MAAKKDKENNNNIIKYILAAVAGIAVCLIGFFLIKSPAKEQMATYRHTDTSGITIEMTYYAKGDRVYKQTAINTIPYSTLGVKTAEEAKELIGDLLEEGKNIKGYSDEVEYKDDVAIETVTIDYDTVNIDEVKDLQGAYFSDGDLDEGVSFEKSTKWLEDNGFVKVEK